MFETHHVRIVMIDGEPWWVLADVCEVLEIENAPQAGGRLDDDEKGICIIDTLGGPQRMMIISEPGLYKILMTSRKPEAHRRAQRRDQDRPREGRRTAGH